MKRIICCLLLCVSLLNCGYSQPENQASDTRSEDRYPIIPRPAKLEPRQGNFVVSRTTTVMVPFANAELKTIAETFVSRLNTAGGLGVTLRNTNKMALPGNLISFIPSTNTQLGDEGYRLDIQPNLVQVEAYKPKGFFYAVQSLYQLLPPEVFSPQRVSQTVNWSMPACRIEDQPRYVYRGLHLDVGRHMFPVAFIKKYIDLIAMHKMNQFHWHLTEDQGWRIEIKKYPKLTQVGSMRNETLIGQYYDYDPQVYDKKPYGGFYTQDEIREVVRYAQSKYVNVIPEIELPGHSLAALKAYPEYGCSGGPYETATKWGIFEDIYCPYEKTFTFLEDILTEVMALFPSQYIHIGGDEAPKASWRKSPFAQNLIKQLKLKNEHELQSYFITRVDKFITSKGRKMIGWDEILEGGLSPNATVMSWRGIKGGIEAAKQNHDVVMTPGNFVYLDHYQADPAQEPIAIGGYTPLDETYSYEPTPAELNAQQAKYILGAQANVWTEYMRTPEYVEYMVWPRAAALAEVVWTPKEQKNWTDFSRRIQTHFARLKYLGVNYAPALYEVTATTKPLPNGQLEVTLNTKVPVSEIRYTTDGSEAGASAKKYDGPFTLDKTTVLRAVALPEKQYPQQGHPYRKEFLVSKVTGKPYQLANQPTRYTGGGGNALTDGKIGYARDFGTMAGFKAQDFSATFDLNQPTEVSRVMVGFGKSTFDNMLLPKALEVAVSDDGQTFRTIHTLPVDYKQRGQKSVVRLETRFMPVTTRYVRVTALNPGKTPADFAKPNQDAWLLVDEVTIE
ncbi:family 20 glycosylhydrolase [Nibrella viscosa]|uniref:beta-N-acetylhexosaminidase n=1 Tax=Nibrella viscosa TaxID=1084524 RepID=A0ABP8K2W4_9BACT